MAESLTRTPIGWSRSSTDIDLEDLSPQAQTAHDGRRFFQERNQKLARQIVGSAKVIFRHNSNDEISEIISDDECLKKNYRKIAGRSNFGLAEQTFLYKGTNAEELKFEKYDTWSACYEQLRSSMEKNESALEICLITPDTTNLGRVFSFIHRVFLLGNERLQQAYSVPSQMVIRILQSQWRLGDATMNEITESVCAKELSLPAWKPNLPSHCNKEPEDYARVPLKFPFKWINAPYYVTDLTVYVFRPYGKHPQVKTLDVILTSTEYEQVRRAIVVANSHSTLVKLRHNFLSEVFQDDVSGLLYIMQLFRVVSAKVTEELVTFLTKACDDINYMAYEGRLRPSASKMQYLRHLEDCHRVAKDCCRENRCTLQMLVDQINLIEGHRADDEITLINELEMAMKDLSYLYDEVESSLQRIPDVCRAVREQLDFLQIRRTSILGILAGLYLPLAFVASFLGMNIDQYTFEPSWRNVTTIDPTNPENITITKSKIVDDRANQSWSLANFFEIAVPLMVGTILVPLIIGSIIRGFLQALGRGRIWWRLLFPFILVGYSIFSAIFMERFWFALVLFVPFYLLTLLNVLSAFKSAFSSRGEKGHWIRLTYWLMNTACLLCIGTFIGGDVTLGIVGAVYGISLFVVWWLRPDFYYRWDQGRRPKAKET